MLNSSDSVICLSPQITRSCICQYMRRTKNTSTDGTKNTSELLINEFHGRHRAFESKKLILMCAVNTSGAFYYDKDA